MSHLEDMLEALRQLAGNSIHPADTQETLQLLADIVTELLEREIEREQSK